MRRVIGYEGEGRVKRAIYSDNEPAYGRVTGMVAGAVARGYAVIGGTLPIGESDRDREARLEREYKARKRARRVS